MDEQRRLGDKWREGDVEVARSLAVPVGQDKVPSLKCSVTSTPLQGSRQRPLSAPLRGSLHKAPGFAGGYLLRPMWRRRVRCLDRAAGERLASRGLRSVRRNPAMLKAGRWRARSRFWSIELKKLIGLMDLPLGEFGRVIRFNALTPAEKSSSVAR